MRISQLGKLWNTNILNDHLNKLLENKENIIIQYANLFTHRRIEQDGHQHAPWIGRPSSPLPKLVERHCNH